MSSPLQIAPSSGSRQATSSRMMKTTKRARPFLKDTLDLFATLIVSLELTTHKHLFHSYPNSFTTDEAATNLSSLKFSQSNRGPDPREPNRIITTTTTTTFSMSRDMAKSMAQHFMDARLIENAIDRNSNIFKDKGIYVLTPKGLHVLERFISKNGMTADHLLRVFATQPICMKLLHLERRAADDEIIISQGVVTALFRRFAGREPNYPSVAPRNMPMDAGQEYHERSKGIQLTDVVDRQAAPGGKALFQTYKFCFPAVGALEWLCDFTSIVGRDEAAEMAAQFVRFGLITLVHDKRKLNDNLGIIFTVRGVSSANGVATEGEFRCTAKAVYRVTEEGRRVARWEPSVRSHGSPNVSKDNLQHLERLSVEGSTENATAVELAYGAGSGAPAAAPTTITGVTDAKIQRRISMAEKLKTEYHAGEKASKESKSNSERLKHILEEPALRSLFREFLKGNFCEENLSFYLDVQDFKRRFSTTSSAAAAASDAGPSTTTKSGKNTPGQAAMEKHNEALITMAFVIYNTYLAPSSPLELNIDHGIRNDLVAYLNQVLTESTGKAFNVGRMETDQANAFSATQLQTMIRLYEKIQLQVFRLMAEDSVPKFIKTARFMALRNWVEEYEAVENDSASDRTSPGPSVPPGLEAEPDELGGAYLTVSQAANEKAQHAAAVAAVDQLSKLKLSSQESLPSLNTITPKVIS